MRKSTKTNENLAAKQADELLFASLYMTMGDILQANQTLANHPELGEEIRETLYRMMNEELPKFLEVMTFEELKKAAKNRVEEWKKSIGVPSMSHYTSLSKYWGVPLDDFIGEEITPQLIYNVLNCNVVGQHDYKQQLATSFRLYLMKKDERSCNIDLPKSNLLVCGPSGSGKTYGVQTLANYFGIRVIIVHCNTLVQEGIVGSNISDYFTDAWMSSKLDDKDKKKEELSHAIVCFDEFDKLFGKSYYGDTIANEILSLIDDDGEVRFKESYNHQSNFVSIPTKKMMFVFTGVFEGMDKIRSGESFGFRNTAGPCKAFSSSDLLKYGIKPEIVGRIQNYTTVERLSVNDLYELLNSKKGSPLNDFLNYFRMNGVEVNLTEDAKMLLAQTAYDKNLGARGLKGMINSVLSDEMFDLSKKRLDIDRDFVEQHIN